MIPIRRLDALSNEERADLCNRAKAFDDGDLDDAGGILNEVRKRGDAAIRRLAEQFGDEPFGEVRFEGQAVPPPLRAAIDAVHDRVTAFHERDLPRGFEFQPTPGVTLGASVVPYRRAGIYAPGGRATYPSTVIMAAVPARIAGVDERILVTPSPSPAVLYAAERSGISRVFRVGGAQAIAALAYGTETIPKADIIVGPGNRYVNAAKFLVGGDDVAIDFIAGPTEILILWDGTGRTNLIAAEMAAQAEHDPQATAILVTPSGDGAVKVVDELRGLVDGLDRGPIITEALKTRGLVLVAGSDAEAVEFANDFAPEHLWLMGKIMEARLSSVRTAGAVSAGAFASVALADYGSGPNHILPTMGHARWASALSARTFVRTMPYQRISEEGLRALAPAAIALARAEGLTAHARAIEMRL